MLSDRAVAGVAAAFDLGEDAQIAGPAQRGELGEVWQLQTVRGRWAVKRLFEPQDEHDQETNAAFADLVYASAVNTPQLLRTPGGHLIVDVEGQHFRAYSWVDIAAADPMIDPALVGELVARLHRIEVHRDEEVDPWFTDPVGAERWRDLAAQHLAAASRWGTQLSEYVDELAQLESLVEPPRSLQVCHRDLWADNVRVHHPGGLCVFDWEDAGNCDPSHELATVLFEYARGDALRADILMAAYVAAGGPGRIAGRGTFTMAIAQLGHIGERACQLWLDDDREHADFILEQFLDARLDVAGIDLLIGATRPYE